MPDDDAQDSFDDAVWSTAATDRQALDDLPYEPGRPRGHVRTDAIGTPAQQEVVRGWVSGVPEEKRSATLHFLIHLLASTQSALRWGRTPQRFDGYVPVDSRLIRKHFRQAEWRPLEEQGLLLVRPHNRVRRRSREFRVHPERWGEFLEAGALAQDFALTPSRVDLATGRRSTRRVKSDRTTRSGHPLPALARAAIDAVGPSPFNPAAIREHLVRLRDRADAEAAGTAGTAARCAARGRYFADLACFDAVFAQGAVPLEGDLWEYRPAYRMQKMGRIGQKGGGLQSCSRAMKAAAYTGVPHLVNLDLKSSQARILIGLMEEAGIEPTWLRRYGDCPEGKEEAARYVGVSVDTWKECLYAALMGARVASSRSVARSEGKIRKAILSDVGRASFDEAYGRFLRLTADLRDELGRWHEHLVTAFVADHGRRNNVDGKTYLSNAVGATVAVEDLAEEGKPHVLKAKLAALLLQGREAAFTHALTASAADHGFRVISHEHDGVVTIGTVPDGVVAFAADAAGLRLDLVELVRKAFA